MAIAKPTSNLFFDTRTKLKGEKYTVKLTVYFQGEKKRYKLPYHFTKDEWLKINSPNLRDAKLKEDKAKLDYLVGEKFEQALKAIGSQFSFDKFEPIYFEKNKPTIHNKDIYFHYQLKVDDLRANDKVGNAQVYLTAKNSLQKFKPKLSFDEVTTDFLVAYEKHMKNAGRSDTYISINLRTLRALFNEAIAKGVIDNSTYPFSKNRGDKKFKVKNGVNIKKALTDEQLKTLKYITPKSKEQKKALDMWWFSFYANGINMADLCRLQYKNIQGDKIVIIRHKTEETTSNSLPVQIHLLDELKAIIDKYGNKNVSGDMYIFNILQHGISAQKERNKVQSFTRNINKHLKNICKDLGFDFTITTYWARHSYSTLLKRRGSSIEYISESLGHTSIETTKNYLASFSDETIKQNAKHLTDI